MVLCYVLEDTHLVSLTRHSCLRWIFTTLSPGILSNYLPCYSYPVSEVWGIQGQGFRKAQGLIRYPWLLCVSTTHPPGCYCCHRFTMVFPHHRAVRQASSTQVLWRRKEHILVSSPVVVLCPPLPRPLCTK